jgi:hypothetical protein
MGWSISYSPERDDSKVVYLDRPFSYELLKEYGCMRQFLTSDEARMFYRNGEDEDAIGPETWEGGNPADFFDIFSRVREGLHSQNDNLPITHFLSYVNWGEYHDRDPLGGSTVINVPPGPRSYTYPHDPMIKLDGGHENIEHRHEIQRYSIRIDPEKLGPEWNKRRQESALIHFIVGEMHVYSGAPREFDPIIEEPDG